MRKSAWRSAGKALSVVVVAVFALSSLTACASASSTSSSSSNSVDSNAIIRVNNVEPTSTLLPGNVSDTAGWKVVTQLFDGLVTFSAKGKLIYDEAESITPNDDASVYTIVLKKGLKFSNGEKVTAEIYKRSWSYAANAANGQVGASIFAGIEGYDALQDENGDKDAQLSGLTVVDDRTLQVTLSAPDSSFPYKVGDIAFLPLPSVALKNPESFGKNPNVSNGPYILKSWTPNKSIKIVRNSKYNGVRKAKNGGITYVVYDELEAAYSDLEAGNLDVLDSIPTSALTTYKSDTAITAYSKPGPAFKSITIPQSLEHFQGEEGKLRRQAISYAINRTQIVNKIMHGSATVATDFLAPVIKGYSKTLAGNSVLKYDKNKAKQLWAQANKISEWSGTFDISYNSDADNKQWVDAVANSIKNTLGIDAEGNPYSTSKEFSTAVNNRTVTGAFRSGLQSDYPHPEGYLVQAYDSSAADGKGLNNGDYKSSEFDNYIDEAAKETNLNSAITIYRQAEELLLQDLPVIPLWYANVAAGSSTSMAHVEFNYMGLPAYQNLTKNR